MILRFAKMGLVVIALTIVLPTIPACAQHVPAYFTRKEMPDMLKFLPEPPAFSTSFFADDSIRYEWGKLMRMNYVRSEIAKRDAVYGLQTIIQEFSTPFGMQISEQGTPQIYKLLKESLATCDSICAAHVGACSVSSDGKIQSAE